MSIMDLIQRQAFWAAAGEGGQGGGEGGGQGGGEGGGQGGGEGGGQGGGEGGGQGTAKWWEGDEFSDEERNWLTAKGMALDDQGAVLRKALRSYRAAEQRLGKPAESLMDRPGKDQDLSEWIRANAAVFGLPDKAEEYQVDVDGLPEGLVVDEVLLERAKEHAFEHGVPPAMLGGLVKVYAEHQAELAQKIDDELATATQAMMDDLVKDWGDQLPQRLALARQGIAAVAEKAGLDADGVQALAAAMKEKVGDAAIMRFGAAIADMLGEDQIKGLGRGRQTLGTTPEDARQRLAQLRSPEGEYYRAVQADNRAEIERLRPEIERLTRIAAAGG